MLKIENHIQVSENYNYPINDDFGDNLEIINSNNDIVYSWVDKRKTGKREVILDITTFRGYGNAIHYYGNLKSYSLKFTTDKNGIGRMNTSGYSLNGVYRKYVNFFNGELVRPITETEIKKDIDRWYGYKVGDLTNAFESEEEIIKIAKELFNILFKGNWYLTINSYSNKYNETVELVKIEDDNWFESDIAKGFFAIIEHHRHFRHCNECNEDINIEDLEDDKYCPYCGLDII